MKPILESSMAVTFRFHLVAAIVVLITVAGCGLALSVDDKLDRAQKAYEESDFRAAIIDSKDVLIKEPDNLRGRLLLGRASLRVEDAASARKELSRAVELGADISDVAIDLGRAMLWLRQFDQVLEEINPDDAKSDADRRQIYQLRGEALLGLNRPQEARELFSKILVSDDSNVEAQLGIVSSYVRERNYLQARATLDQIISANGDVIDPWLASGELYFETGNAKLAETHFSHALELAEQQNHGRAQIRALTGLGDALLAQSETDRARSIAEDLIGLAPNSPSAMHLTARVAYIDEDWVKAERLLQSVLKGAPNFRPAQLLLGAVHLRNGNLGQAEMYLSAVVAAVPDNSDARNLLARTRLRQQDARAAQELLQPMLDGVNPNAGSLAIAAQASLGQGDFDQAAEYLRRAVEANPENVSAQLDLAAAYMMVGRLPEAKQILDTVDFTGDDADHYRGDILSVMSLVRGGNTVAGLAMARGLKEQWPGNARVFMLIGSLEMLSNDAAAAHLSFEEALKISPSDILPIRFLAAAEESAGNFPAATKRYLEIIEIEPNDMVAIMGLARLSARVDDTEGARHWLERAIAVEPEAFSSRRVLGQLLLSQSEFESAKQLAEETIAIASNNADAYRLLGSAQLSLRNPDEASKSFARAVALDPDKPEYRIALARAQNAAGNQKAAQDTIVAAYEYNPKDIPTALLLAAVRVNNGETTAAMKIANDLEKVHPDNSAPLSLQGELLLRSGRMVEAAAKYEKVLDIENSPRLAARAYQVRKAAGLSDPVRPLIRHLNENPLNTEVRIYLAQHYQVAGDNQSAIDEFQKVVSTAPDNYIALNNLAWTYFLVNDKRAEEIARRAYAVAPNHGFVIDTLGWILIQKGELDEGVSMLRKAAISAEGNSNIRYHLAVGLSKQGNKSEALGILESILSNKDSFVSRENAEKLMAEL